MEASPPSEIVKSLTILHQNQHQAFLDLYKPYSPAQEQTKSQCVLQKLLQITTSPAVFPALVTHVIKIACTDDSEAFLELFEHVAAAWEWPKEEWAL